MISYAQNLEDVVLNRVFADEQNGTYIDVGAGHPTFDSVTRAFYDRGWTGLNVEPRDAEFNLLCQHRPEDINLNAGISDQSGSMPFFEVQVPAVDSNSGDGGGLSTFDATTAASLGSRQGFQVKRLERKVKTLAEILQEHQLREVTFLKIDVEGWERQVLSGMDWNWCRPRVVLVESTLPMTSVPAHDDWDGILTHHGYLFSLFDGLNRFYLREEDKALQPLLQVSANVLDEFTRSDVVNLRDEHLKVSNELAGVKSELARFQRSTDPDSLKLGLWIARRLHRVKRRLRMAS